MLFLHLQKIIKASIYKNFPEVADFSPRVLLNDRQDISDFQCNDCFAIAKQVKKAPFIVAETLTEDLNAQHSDDFLFSFAKPGFLNISLKDNRLIFELINIYQSENCGYHKTNKKEKIIIDYGGPNIAKPLHVGHLRSAIIGQTINNMLKKSGHNTISDIHLGDFGLQMGQIIIGIELEYPSYAKMVKDGNETSPPFTMDDLEIIYPKYAKKCKEDENIASQAREITSLLQKNDKYYTQIWDDITKISKENIKINYDNLHVYFDLWKGEADVAKYIDNVEQILDDKGLLTLSEGAKIVKFAEEMKIPPLIFKKSNGAALYSTTDLATIYDRVMNVKPDRMIYVADQRQKLHYKQFFTTASLAGLMDEDKLEYYGFGTINGNDNKPFKTRDGSIYKLEKLINDVVEKAEINIKERNENSNIEDARNIGLCALKFADLANPKVSDYIFDLDKFLAFEGKTGPYIIYAAVRIKSILRKIDIKSDNIEFNYEILKNKFTINENVKKIITKILTYPIISKKAINDREPFYLFDHIYQVASLFSKFYHSEKIHEQDGAYKTFLLCLLLTILKQIEETFSLINISIPEKM